jgi:hypothetical protein
MVKTMKNIDDAEDAALYRFLVRKHVHTPPDKKLFDLWWLIRAKQIINDGKK